MTAQPAEIRGPVLVTGGGQGLGRAFCHAYADRGVAVAVADIDVAKARTVADELRARGGSAVGVHVDVGDPDSVARMASTVEAELGGVTVLVNNAAIFSTLKLQPYAEIPLAEWTHVLRVNVTGAYLCCRAFVPGMASRGYGKVVNISSATIWTGRAGYLHYVTSKAALVGMTRSLASEVGPHGVRVNAITPGSTVTEVERETISAEARQTMAEMTALRRSQVPSDLVGTVLFLSSSQSDFITGQTINVDGGLAFH